MKEKVEIKIDLLSPFLIEREYEDIVYGRFKEMIEDIENSKIAIKIDEKEHKIKANFQEQKNTKYFRYYSTLILKFTVNMEELFAKQEVYTSDKKEKLKLSEEEKIEYQTSSVITEIEKYIMDFTFAMNLAYLGLFEFGGAKIYINEKQVKKQDIILVSWLDTYINFLKNKWPVIHKLKFKQVWKWLNTKTNFIEGISKTAIDRALNALTYTMGDVSYEQIFYVLMGIEAIYNDNDSNGITEQIRAKTESLLKRPEEYRKKISKFYDNRSKFIHGRLNFPNKYCPYDATEEFEEFYFKKYIETVKDAMSILISTIQEYIIQDAKEMITNVTATLK